jgi:hypothetical protein
VPGAKNIIITHSIDPSPLTLTSTTAQPICSKVVMAKADKHLCSLQQLPSAHPKQKTTSPDQPNINTTRPRYDGSSSSHAGTNDPMNLTTSSQ